MDPYISFLSNGSLLTYSKESEKVKRMLARFWLSEDKSYIDTHLGVLICYVSIQTLCDDLVTCPLMLIQEFYSNMHEIDRSIPQIGRAHV